MCMRWCEPDKDTQFRAKSISRCINHAAAGFDIDRTDSRKYSQNECRRITVFIFSLGLKSAEPKSK